MIHGIISRSRAPTFSIGSSAVMRLRESSVGAPARFSSTNSLAYSPDWMRYSVSDTAEYGDYSRGPRVVDARVKQEMKKILGEIQDGTFAREWIAEDDNGRPNYNKWREEGAAHPIEETGKKLRGMMSWVDRPITETA